MLFQIITYILIGAAAITNLYVGYQRQVFYMNHVFATAKWPKFSTINAALANKEFEAWHPRLRRFKTILVISWILPACILVLIGWQLYIAA